MLLDLQAAAERLGVHYSTAQEWAADGTLPAFKLPGRRKWSIDAEDLQSFIDSQKEAAPKPGPKVGPKIRTERVKTGPNRLGQDELARIKDEWMRKYA